MINNASIYSACLLAGVLLPQLIFLLIGSRKAMPRLLYQGRFLYYGIISIFSFLSIVILTLFFSNDYGVVARWFGWLISSHTCVALVFISWIIFFMNGYEPHYLFKKIVVPAHMNILIIVIYWLTFLFSWNYWAMIPGFIFSIFSFLWSFKAYQLTKPTIDENIPLREDYE